MEDARRAVHKMQGERIGKNQVSTCYARSIKTQVLWIHGLMILAVNNNSSLRTYKPYESKFDIELYLLYVIIRHYCFYNDFMHFIYLLYKEIRIDLK